MATVNPWSEDASVDVGGSHHILAIAASFYLISEEVRASLMLLLFIAAVFCS